QEVVQVYEGLGDPDPDPAGTGGPDQDKPFHVLGGKSITVNAGSYDISGVYGSLDNDDFLIAAVDKLTIAGNVAFRNNNEGADSAEDGLILMSAGSIALPQGTAEQHASLSYGGDFLGIGSLDTVEVINVDLTAESEVHVRSLDSLVINNSSMRTSGNGADFVHLRAFEKITANNLVFSENMKRIVMEAMTINLMNVAFPGGSQVNLNSLYGGVDGKYPTFGSPNQQYGRVNFIQNIQHGAHLLNSRSAFDQFGGGVTIGKK
ncbi:MAG: hypothetical protein VB997_00950, partial [Opitutales bacterium]